MKRVENTTHSGRIFGGLRGVSSGDETLRLLFDILHETLRRELKIRRTAEEFLADFEVFYLCQMLDITSQKKKMILDGEIKDAKPSSFSSDY